MLPRPPENPEHYYQTPLEVRPDLQEEYEQGVQELLIRLRKKGFDPILVLAFGSLTREKELKPHKEKMGVLESDADFIVITKKTLRMLLTSGSVQVGRGEEHGATREKPFSEHIPNFDVKVWTPEYCMAQLQEIADYYESYDFTGKEWVDLVEDARVNNRKSGLVSILIFGIPVFTSEKDESFLTGIRSELHRAQRAVEAYRLRYAELERTLPR